MTQGKPRKYSYLDPEFWRDVTPLTWWTFAFFLTSFNIHVVVEAYNEYLTGHPSVASIILGPTFVILQAYEAYVIGKGTALRWKSEGGSK